MAATTETEKQVTLKLMVNKERNKVLFAEAGKDFVDVLFSLLTLPLGTIARLSAKESNMEPVSVGCLSSLYESVANLDQQCLLLDKQVLLQPCNLSEDYCRSLKLNIDDTPSTKFFMCPVYSHKIQMFSTFANQTCRCGYSLSRSGSLKTDHAHEGFVTRASKFIITDDLIVMPNSIGTTFGLLQMNCGTIDISSAEEMIVHVNKKKVMDLLKCCLVSKTTLTDLFLGKKPTLERSIFSPFPFEGNSADQIQVKLVMRKLDGKILFAQAEEDFVDMLFSFLTLPLGRVIRLLKGNCCMGNVDGMYKSIADLNVDKYFKANHVKNRVVDPLLAPQFKIWNQILSMPIYASFCYDDRYDGQLCISGYGDPGNKVQIEFLYPQSSEKSRRGYVEGPAMFMVTDGLTVAPASPITTMSLLKRLETPLSDLNEKIVTVGVNEVLNILKASLSSTSALTNGLSHLLTTQVKKEK